jgi:hypothetical protein
MSIFSGKYYPKHLLLICTIVSMVSPTGSAQDCFQQEVNFKIHVALDDKRHELHAFQEIEYINNSPDTLGFLFFHLWPNAWSGNDTRLARQIFNSRGRQRLFDDPRLRGYIDSLDFHADGRQVHRKPVTGYPDICRIYLNEPLSPGDTVFITTPFRVKIPGGETSQLGHIGESYQITNWYPKPAVYDKSGWHPMPWLDMARHRSETGSYTVFITLPENYVVGATGNLRSEDEIRWLNMLAADTTWKRTYFYTGTRFPPSSGQMKTLEFYEGRSNDFAWFADKRFNVVQGSVELTGTGREVTTWIMFTSLQARLWMDAPEHVTSAILYFSELLGDYPYDSYTAVQSILGAGSGNAYPGINVIGFEDDAYSLNEAIALNIARSLLNTASASGECHYPFIDEGIARSYAARYMNQRSPGRKLWEVYLKNRRLAEILDIDDIPVHRADELRWLGQARLNLGTPVNMKADDYGRLTHDHGNNYKAMAGFDYLRAYLGDSLFDTVMQAWYGSRKFRHTQHGDFRNFFESETGEDLEWFFIDFIGTTKRLDYQMVRFRDQYVLVENNGELSSPLIVAGMKGDSVIFKKWVEGFHGQKRIDIPRGEYSEVSIDPGRVMPELYRNNNTVRTSGPFPGFRPVRPRFLFNIDDPGQRTIVYLPLVNWTRENGLMPGISLHNGFPLPKPAEYLLTPFYSFKNASLAGSGKLLFNITPYDNFFRLATVTLEGTRFGAPGDQNYHLAKAGLDLHLRPGSIQNSLRHRLFGRYIAASDLLEITFSQKTQLSSFVQFGYGLERIHLVNPFNLLTSFESHSSFQKASIELNYRYSYHGRDNGLDIRVFTGAMVKNESEVPFHALSPGGRSGREQYLYQGTYPDRFSVFSDTFFSRQMTLSEGGLVTPLNESLGYSDWLFSLSFESSLPGRAGWIPVRPFANFLVNESGPGISQNSRVFYEAGLKAGIWDFFEIYFPLLVSENIGSIGGPLKNRIRFIFKLDAFDQLDFLGIMN